MLFCIANHFIVNDKDAPPATGNGIDVELSPRKSTIGGPFFLLDFYQILAIL
jgi:hypothetical protein